jgi:hypothetical protein
MEKENGRCVNGYTHAHAHTHAHTHTLTNGEIVVVEVTALCVCLSLVAFIVGCFSTFAAGCTEAHDRTLLVCVRSPAPRKRHVAYMPGGGWICYIKGRNLGARPRGPQFSRAFQGVLRGDLGAEKSKSPGRGPDF